MDPRLTAVFMAASSPVAAGHEPQAPATTSQSLSGPQASDIVWALGLLQWCPPGSGGRRRLAQLVKLVAQAASSKRGIEEGYITNVLWALERLEISVPKTEKVKATREAEARGVEETAEAMIREEAIATAEVGVDGEGGAGDTAWAGSRAVWELRRRVENLPFRAIPSLFKVGAVNTYLGGVFDAKGLVGAKRGSFREAAPYCR